MIKVAVAYSGDSRGLNGAALYVNRFKKNKAIFEENGIQPFICDYNTISGKENDEKRILETERAYADSKIHTVKSIIKRILSHTYFGNLIYIRYAWKKPGLKAIRNNVETIANADIVIANDLFTAYYCIRIFPDKPLIFVMHNSGRLIKTFEDKLPHIKGKKLGNSLENIENDIYQKSKRIVFVSEIARRSFCEERKVYKDKTIYIPVGIENADYVLVKPLKPINFICVGTVCRRKNQVAIVDAMKKMDKNDACLTIVGHGEMLEECKKKVSSSGIKNVLFTGQVDSVEDYLNNASAFIIASLDEGLPAVGVEALRAGLPILTTDVGGCSELLRYQNGIIIQDPSSDAIYKEMSLLIDRKEQIQTMGKKSRQLYEDEYSLLAMVKKFKEILEK